MKKFENMTEPELRKLMAALAGQVEWTALVHEVEKPLFVLLVFNDPTVTRCVSNCERAAAAAALRESADRLERRQDVPR